VRRVENVEGEDRSVWAGERVRNAKESECICPSTRICEDLVNQLSRRRHLRLESCTHVRLPTITKLLRCRHSLLLATLR
jgi:hypothetical protein